MNRKLTKLEAGRNLNYRKIRRWIKIIHWELMHIMIQTNVDNSPKKNGKSLNDMATNRQRCLVICWNNIILWTRISCMKKSKLEEIKKCSRKFSIIECFLVQTQVKFQKLSKEKWQQQPSLTQNIMEQGWHTAVKRKIHDFKNIFSIYDIRHTSLWFFAWMGSMLNTCYAAWCYDN